MVFVMLQKSLDIDSCHYTATRRSNRLTIFVVLDISACKHAMKDRQAKKPPKPAVPREKRIQKLEESAVYGLTWRQVKHIPMKSF